MKIVAGLTLLLTAVSTAILVKFAQVGLEVQGAADQVKANPLKALTALFTTKRS